MSLPCKPALLYGMAMKLTRRENLTLMMGAAGMAALPACAAKDPATPSPFLDGGVGVIAVRGGKRIYERTAGFASGMDEAEGVAKRPFTLDTPFRVASVSKVAVTITARGMAEAGVLNMDMDIGPAIGLPMRHPKYPGVPVTLQHLLSHRSGISDPEIYWTEPDGDIRTLISPEMFKGGKPGDWFEYANINYGLAATIMEAVSGKRFDQLTQEYILGGLGLDIGFNWAGVSSAKRASGATLYRLVDGKITAQTDGPEALASSKPVVYGDNPDFDIETYVPGTNGTLLSPQGGLRASLNDLIGLAQKLAELPDLHQADWVYDGSNGKSEGGHFVSFGKGLYVYPPELSPIPGQLMVGHHGEAYGVYCGMWHLPQHDIQIAHGVTSTPQPPKPAHPGPPAIAAESRILLDEAIKALGL